MSNEYIIDEIREEIGILTLNRPQALNSINEQMLAELSSKIKEFNQQPKIKVIILKGIEQAFAAGIDVKELAAHFNTAKTAIQNMQDSFKSILYSQKPIIAAVSGFSLGIGTEIALACDIILAADNARFGLPELSIGLIPCFGGCGLLASRIGKAKAMDMILSGKAISADEAEKCGLISRIVTPESLQEESLKLAKRIAALPEQTVSAAKKLIIAASDSSSAAIENLSALSALESPEFRQILQSYAVQKD